MICFPNAKINIGLNVLSKRQDGFHNIESIFYPVPVCDALEFVAADTMQLTVSGFTIPGKEEDNLVLKAYNTLTRIYKLPPLKIHLHKSIPVGSGLGGGSADTAFFIKTINEYFKLGMGMDELLALAGKLGSDCPFFIENRVMLVSGRGEVLQSSNLDLSGKYLLIIKPKTPVSTQLAFEIVKPGMSNISLAAILSKPIEQWKEFLVNDFEIPIYKKYPQIAAIKNNLYKHGAIYASMSGSGSAVYGLFKNKPELSKINPNYYFWVGKL